MSPQALQRQAPHFRLDDGAHPAAIAAALHVAGLGVVDHALAGVGALGRIDLVIAGQDDDLIGDLVFDVVGLAVHRGAVVHLLLERGLLAVEHHAIGLAVLLEDVGGVGVDFQRALGDHHIAAETALAAVVEHVAIVGIGVDRHRLVAIAGLGHCQRRQQQCGKRQFSGQHSVHSGS